jgi:hypothetical protein
VHSLTALLISLYIASPAAQADVPAPAPAEAETASSASAPPADETPAPTAEVPTSTTAPQSAPTAAAETPSEAKPEKAAVDPVALKKAGYKLVNENGQELYCREDLSTGSHLKKTKTCLTERELAALQDNTRREVEYMRTRQPPPAGK